MRRYISNINDQLRDMGLAPISEGVDPEAPVQVEDVSTPIIPLERQMQAWGLGGGSALVDPHEHLGDFNLAEGAQAFLARSPVG